MTEPSSKLKRLLDEILEHPEDTRALQVYADALQVAGDPRGEFIQLQVEAEALPASDPRRGKIEKAAAKLEKAHRRTWLDGLPMVRQGTFRRGLLHTVVATSDDFFKGLDELLAREPVRGIKLTKYKRKAHEAKLATLLKTRAMEQIDLSQCRLDAPQIEALFAEADTSRLAVLKLRDDPIGVEGTRVVASRPLDRLEVLWLGGSDSHYPGDEALDHLLGCATLRRLRELDLWAFGISPDGAARLARSPILEHVETLNLQSNALEDAGVIALATSPYLRRLTLLNLGHSQVGDAGVRALAEAPFVGNLRENLPIWDLSQGDLVSAPARQALEARMKVPVVW